MKPFTFHDLIAPITTENFLDAYWEQKHLFVSREEPDYYAQLFSRKDIGRLLFNEKHRSGATKMTKYDNGRILTISPNDLVDMTETRRAYDQGYTIQVANLDTSHTPLITLCSELRHIFEGDTNVVMFLTPPAAQGIGRHFDDYDLFILQVDGEKQWDVYEPYVQYGLREQMDTVPAPEQYNLIDKFHMKAGDLLYLPRGFVHEVHTPPDASSLHLTLGVYGVSWANLITAALEIMRLDDPRFRKFVPPGALKNAETRDDLQERLEEMLNLFSSQANAVAAAKKLEAGSQRFLLEKANSDGKGGFISGMQKWSAVPDNFENLFDDQDTDPAQEIGLDTVLAKNQSFPYRTRQQDDIATLSYGQWSVQMPARLKPVLDYIADSDGEFPISSLPHLTDQAKLVIARRLVSEGLLYPAVRNSQE